MTGLLTLPGTDLSVSRLCLGGNRLGAQLDRDASFALLDAFVAAGGNFVDTAHVYADWLPDVERSCSEKTIGRWLASRELSDAVVIATKIGHPQIDRSDGARLDRASLRRDVAECLDNLQLGRLDLVYLHRDDRALDAEDVLGALEELRADGQILHYGASNWTAARLRAATAAAQRHGWQGFVANQAEWSLAKRNPGSAADDLHAMDMDMVDWHRASRAAAIPYSAQARGYFDKLFTGGMDATTAQNYDSHPNRQRGVHLAALAARHGVTPTQAMLALFRLMPFLVVPVVGCHTPGQIAASFLGANLKLTAEEAGPLLSDLGFQAGQ
ncbi:MAG: aldo/keto reductase [Paracoccaceae bacterium]